MGKWSASQLKRFINEEDEQEKTRLYTETDTYKNLGNKKSNYQTTKMPEPEYDKWGREPITSAQTSTTFKPSLSMQSLNLQKKQPNFALTDTLNQMYAEKKEKEKFKFKDAAQTAFANPIESVKTGFKGMKSALDNASYGVAKGVGLEGVNRALGGERTLEEKFFNNAQPNQVDSMARGVGEIGGQFAPQLGAAALTGGASLGVQALGNAVAAGTTAGLRGYGAGKDIVDSSKDALRGAIFAGAGTVGSNVVGNAIGETGSKLGALGKETLKGLGYDLAGYAAERPTYAIAGDEAPTLKEMSTDMIVGMLMGIVPDALEVNQLDLPTLRRVKAEAGPKLSPEVQSKIDRRIYEMQEGYSLESDIAPYEGMTQGNHRTYQSYDRNGMPLGNNNEMGYTRETPQNNQNNALENRYVGDKAINQVNPYNQPTSYSKHNMDQYGDKGNKSYNYFKKDAPVPEVYDTYFEMMYGAGMNNIPYDKLPRTEFDTVFPEYMKQSFYNAGQNDRGTKVTNTDTGYTPQQKSIPEATESVKAPEKDLKYEIETKQLLGERQKQVYEYLKSDKDGKKAKAYYLSPELKGVDDLRKVLGSENKLIKFTDDKSAPKLDVMKMEFESEFPEVKEMGLEEFGTFLVDTVKKYKGDTKAIATMKQESKVSEQPKQSTYETTKEVMSKLNKGYPTTLEEVRNSYEYIRDNETSIKEDLKKKTVAELKKQVGGWSAQGKKKPELIDAAYEEMISDVLYRIKEDDSQGISVVMGWGDNRKMVDVYKERVEKRLSEMTQEDLDAKLKKRNEQVLQYVKDRNAKVEAVKNPKTLEEFKEAKKYRKLSAEEQRTYDELFSLANKSKAVETKAKGVAKTSMQMQGDLPNHKITKDVDTRDQSDMWVLKFDEQLSKEDYKKYSDLIKQKGGYYSRYKKGFIFKNEPDLTTKKVDVEEVKANIETTAAEKQKVNADKIRQVADNMQKSIDHKRADRQTNTARRASMAADAERQADELENTQRILRGIAEHLETGEIKHLDKVSAATHIETLQSIARVARREYIDKLADAEHLTYDQRKSRQSKLDNEGYPVETLDNVRMPQIVERGFQLKDLINAAERADVKGILKEKNRLNKLLSGMKENDTPKLSKRDVEDIYKIINKTPKDELPWYVDEYMKKLNRLEKMGITNDSELRAALRELDSITNSNRKIKSPEEIRAEQIKAKERELVNSKITSFFPTPEKVIDQMLDIADIKPGDRVLEPSAGAGDIADKVGIGKVEVVEYNGSLRELLELKGHTVVGSNALEVDGTYNKIIMNPPFEKNQDIQHVTKAFNDNLEADGRIVAIMSNHFTFANDKASIEFRQLVDEYGVWEPLPEGTFKDSKRSTGVNTVMVTLDKPQNYKETMPEADGYSTSNFASTATGPKLGAATGTYTGEAKKGSEIYSEFAEKLGLSIKNDKRLKGALGQQNYRTGLTSIKKANDIPVLAHETGHFLDNLYKFNSLTDKGINKELIGLGKATSRPKDSPAKKKREGIAEFMRLYLTDHEAAKKQAPDFYSHFINTLPKETLKAINGLQKDIWQLTNLSPSERLKKTISFRTDYMGKNKLKKDIKAVKNFDVGMKFKEIYTGVFDKTFPIEWAAREMGGKSEGLKMRDKLGVARGAEEMALYNLEYAQTDYYGKEVGPSFKDITEPIHANEKTRQDFWTYATARRSMDYYNRGLEFTDDIEVAKGAIAELETPEFKKVFDAIQKYNANNLELLVECGMLNKDQVKAMQEVNPNYIPLNRVQEAFEKAGGKGGSKGVKHLKGGGQDIRDPEENIIMNTFSYRKLAQEKMMWKDLSEMADTVTGAGEIMVAASQKYKVFDMDKNQIGKVVKKTLSEMGFEADGLDIDFYSKMFIPDLQAGANQVVVHKDGKPKLYDVNPFLYSVINNQSLKIPKSVTSVISALSKVAQVSKTGIIFNPRYIAYNLARDTGSSLVNTRAGLNPIDIGLGLVEGLKKGDTYKAAMRTGAFTGYFNTSDRKYAQEQIDHIMSEQNTFKRVMGKITHPFETIGDFIEPGELAARLPEYKKTLIKEYRKQYKTNEKREVIFKNIIDNPREYQSIIARATFNARDLSLDFNKSGQWVNELGLNKMNNFFNSQLQGVGKSMRTFTNKEEGTRALLKGVMYLTLPSLGMWAYAQKEDKEMYEELPSYRKDGFMNVPLGDGIFFPIPLPPEYSAIFSALPRRMIEKEIHGNPKAFDGYMESLVDTFIGLDFIPTALKPMYEVATNKNFTGSPILSQGDLSNPPELQYNRYTSPYALKISEIANGISELSPEFMPGFFEVLKSPKQVDHLLKGYTGTLGTMIIKGNPVEGVKDSFLSDARKSPQSMNYYYDYKEQIAHDNRRYKASGEMPTGYSEDLRMAFSAYDREIGDLNDKINEMRDQKIAEDEIQVYTDKRLETMKKANRMVEKFRSSGEVDLSEASDVTRGKVAQSQLKDLKAQADGKNEKWDVKYKNESAAYTKLNSLFRQISDAEKAIMNGKGDPKAWENKIKELEKQIGHFADMYLNDK